MLSVLWPAPGGSCPCPSSCHSQPDGAIAGLHRGQQPRWRSESTIEEADQDGIIPFRITNPPKDAPLFSQPAERNVRRTTRYISGRTPRRSNADKAPRPDSTGSKQNLSRLAGSGGSVLRIGISVMMLAMITRGEIQDHQTDGVQQDDVDMRRDDRFPIRSRAFEKYS